MLAWVVRAVVSAVLALPAARDGCRSYTGAPLDARTFWTARAFDALVAPGLGAPYRVFALQGMRIASVALCLGFTVAVTEAGAVYSFGVGDGRLGHGKGDAREGVFLPKRVEAQDAFHMATVAAGDFHTLALTSCGKVFSWGAIDRESMVHGLGSHDGGGAGDDLRDEDFHIPLLITALLGERVQTTRQGRRCHAP
jgi:hypothetical protein